MAATVGRKTMREQQRERLSPARLRFVALICLCASASSANQTTCGEPVIEMDLSERTNADVYMDWTNALGAEFTGQKVASIGFTSIAVAATDQTTGAFPGGSVRFRNAVTAAGNGGQPLDLLVSVSADAVTYSASTQLVNASGRAGYINPTAFRQALLVENGYACLGVGVGSSVCASGASLDPDTGECIDGTVVTVQGASSASARVGRTQALHHERLAVSP